ncbi:MAG TPA: molybdopterin-binding oxidoreductase, partial [Chloroflexi bacterium]|nr:molybdopterin-binding oxidoreductase [Chloroflexota bacterium]
APAEEPAPLSAGQLERRRFLIRLGGATAAITVVGAGLGAALTRREGSSSVAESPPEGTPTAAPSADDGLLEPAPGTRPETTPIERHYRIDINLTPPAIDEADWRLRITGMVDNPLELTLDDLRNNYEPIDRFITLECISNRIGGNLIGTTLWTGASLQAVLADAGVQEGAAYIRIHARDGFWEILPLETLYADERIMLTYGMDGQPLQQKHGFPLRIYIPDRFGMKQPKWITELEVMATYDQGYWVERGWDEEARVRATSVIDTVQAIDENTVAIGGIAYAGARGISKVEVQIDEGEWVEAQLRPPLSDTTWVIWRYDWPFEAGAHVFRVRCYEGDGTPQIEEENDPHPSGATGIHTAISNL